MVRDKRFKRRMGGIQMIFPFSQNCREIPTFFIKLEHKMTIFAEKCCLLIRIKRAKHVDDVMLKCLRLSGAKACKLYRSRQQLSTDYLFAKIGVDTSEGEPLKGWT